MSYPIFISLSHSHQPGCQADAVISSQFDKMLLLPFLGVFVSFVIWGTFYPVPGFIRPTDDFVRRLSGAFQATACIGQVYRVIEVTRMYAGPWHQDTASHVQGAAFGGFEDYICLINGTEAKASVVIPLGEETVEQDLVVAVGSDEGHSTVSRSPFFPRAAGWAFAWWFLAFLFCFCVGLVPYVAHALRDTKEKLVRYLEPPPKVARLLVADGGSAPLDSLCGTFTSSGSSALLLKGEVDDVFIHRMVEKAIICLEQRRAVAVSPELETCICKSWIVGPRGAVESLTNPVPVVSSVAVDQSSAHQPWQRWALVVYRPEDYNVVYQRVCILLARWREMARGMAVPIEETVPATKTVPDTEDTAAPEGRRRKKNRPNKGARQRRRNRVEKEEREREENAMRERQALSLLAFAARTRTLPALSILHWSVIPLAMSLGMDRKSSPGSHLS